MIMDEKLLNIAATCLSTRALGPGLRSVVWVQGCPLHCKGCISPEWIPEKPNTLISPDKLASELMANPDITGLTISGGEPMLQAKGLFQLIQRMQSIRPINIICFTGFQFETLQTSPPNLDVAELLTSIDLLIDGPYIENKNDNLGLRGSTNQRFIFLTDKLSSFDFKSSMRKVEYQVMDGNLLMVGVPPTKVVRSIDSQFAHSFQEAKYVRT